MAAVMSKTITRPISGLVTHYSKGYGSLTLTLGECGHVQYRKLSQGLPKKRRVRCRDCEALRSGVQSQRGNVREGWDAVTGLPTRTEIAA